MATDVDSSTVVIYPANWDQCQRIVSAVRANHQQHAGNGSRLELQRVIQGLSWQDYARFLEALGDVSVHHVYDGWTLEMMSPRKDHDWVSHLIGRFIDQMTFELGIGIQGVGQMTVSNSAVESSIQPDRSYYVTNEPRVRGKRTYDPAVDPPPDLIVEVDVTNSCVDKMETIARLGIAELWRHDGDELTFYRLGPDGKYRMVDCSGEFPWIVPASILDSLSRVEVLIEHDVVRHFLACAHRRYQEYRSKHAGG